MSGFKASFVYIVYVYSHVFKPNDVILLKSERMKFKSNRNSITQKRSNKDEMYTLLQFDVEYFPYHFTMVHDESMP